MIICREHEGLVEGCVQEDTAEELSWNHDILVSNARG